MDAREIIGRAVMSEARDKVIEDLKHAIDVSQFDPEAAHVNADKALTDFLEALGHLEVVALYEKVEKWFA